MQLYHEVLKSYLDYIRWINALYYIDKPEYYGIQNLLIRMMNTIQFPASAQGSQSTTGQVIGLPAKGIRMAVAGILPIIVTFPFL